MKKTGILLMNLGTPDSPSEKDVTRYLREFLMDPLVIDIPYFFRLMLVNFIILKGRAKSSAGLYKKIWTTRGSPLLFHTLDLAQEVQKILGDGFLVIPCMRYGKPSIASAIEKLKNEKVESIVALPLYPQYSLAATESCVTKLKVELEKTGFSPNLKVAPDFYNNSDFIQNFVGQVQPILSEKKPDHLVFSFHGLPERHVKKTDTTDSHCLIKNDCCEKITQANSKCYRAQCFQTAKLIAEKLNLPKEKYTVSFQSRLGRTPWIKPYTDVLYQELAEKGLKKIAVVSPSFVADCLETLEEIEIRGKESFKGFGGEDLRLVPSLNSNESWVRAVAKMIREII